MVLSIYPSSFILRKPFVFIATNKKVNFDGARCPFSTFLRLQGDHHCACAQKWCHFSFFSKSFQTKKKIKALRPKMTKIASRGSCLKASRCPPPPPPLYNYMYRVVFDRCAGLCKTKHFWAKLKTHPPETSKVNYHCVMLSWVETFKLSDSWMRYDGTAFYCMQLCISILSLGV